MPTTNHFNGNRQAQRICSAIADYVKQQSKDKLGLLEQALEQADEKALCALGRSEMSHLFQIIVETSSVHTANTQIAFEITHDLFALLMKYSDKYPEAKKMLLTKRNRAQFTPLHQLLISGSARNVHDYLKAVTSNFPHEKNKIYADLLISLNDFKNTPLFVVIKAKDRSKAIYFIECLRVAHEAGTITNEQFNQMLIQRNKSGSSALHQAFISNMGDLFFPMVRQARANGLTDKDYKELLTWPNNHKFTPLLECLIESNAQSLQEYLGMVHEAWTHKIILDEEYSELLRCSNDAGFTPLESAVLSGDPEKVRLYFEAVESAFLKGVIKPKDYKSLLLPKKSGGYNILSVVVQSNPEIFSLYFQALNRAKDTHRIITTEDYGALLVRNTEDYAPISTVLTQKPELGLPFLSMVRDAHRNKRITDETYRDLLIKPIFASSTPLHEILKSGDPNILRFYFELVSDARKSKIISDEHYRKLLLHFNTSGLTPLHHALSGSNLESLEVYFNTVLEAKSEGIITSDQYRNLLTSANNGKFTPLISALLSSNPNNLRFYIDKVALAKEDGAITDAEYKRLLINYSPAGFTPLSAILKKRNAESLNVEILLGYFSLLKSAKLTREDWVHILTASDIYGDTPLNLALYSGQLDILLPYLELLESFSSLMDDEFYENYLIGKIRSHITPLHSATSSKNPEILGAYLELISHAREIRPIISTRIYWDLLTARNNDGDTLCHLAVNMGNYDFFCKFSMILERNLGTGLFITLLNQLDTPPEILHCADRTYEAKTINSLIELMKQGYSPLDGALSETSIKKRRQNEMGPSAMDIRDPMLAASMEDKTSLPRQNFSREIELATVLPSDRVHPGSSGISAMMLQTIKQTAQGSCEPSILQETRERMITISKALVSEAELDPNQISFYGSAAQLIANHRSLTDAPKDIDVRLFVTEANLKYIQDNLLRAQKSIAIYDLGPYLLIKGFKLPSSTSSDTIDIQVIKMREGERPSDAMERFRFASHLNVCTDYCTFDSSSSAIIAHPGPDHQHKVCFLNPQGQYIPKIDHLFHLFARPQDCQPQDLFFFLKKWDYFDKAGYDVSALKTAIIHTIVFGYGFNLAIKVFSHPNKTGAEILCRLAGETYEHHPDDVYDRHYPRLLSLVNPLIISIFYDNQPGGTRVLLDFPRPYRAEAATTPVYSEADKSIFFRSNVSQRDEAPQADSHKRKRGLPTSNASSM